MEVKGGDAASTELGVRRGRTLGWGLFSTCLVVTGIPGKIPKTFAGCLLTWNGGAAQGRERGRDPWWAWLGTAQLRV